MEEVLLPRSPGKILGGTAGGLHPARDWTALSCGMRSLRRTLHSYFSCYQRSRTHLALVKDSPEPRAVEPPEQGRVVAIPQVGGLHHGYQRRAA